MSERTIAQQTRDDEDHRLRMCGLLEDDVQNAHEWNDFCSRHFDFAIFAPPQMPPHGAKRGQGVGGAPPHRSSSALAPPPLPTPQ